MGEFELENKAAQDAIEPMLFDDESVVETVKGAKGSGKGRAQFVLTDSRLIRYKKGFLSESTDAYDLENVTKVEFNKSPFKRILTIDGSGIDEKFGLHPDEDCRGFTAAIQDQSRSRSGRSHSS